MRLTPASLVIALALVLPACGDKGGAGGGGGGVVGTWVLDAEAALKSAVAQLEADRQEQLEQMPPEQRDAMKKMMSEQGVVEKMKEQINAMGGTLTIASDKTFTAEMQRPKRDKEVLAGTWTESGGVFTLDVQTKNGKPATGADKEMPLSLKFVEGRLVPAGDDAPPLAFKRK